jgi:hypothetical protein
MKRPRQNFESQVDDFKTKNDDIAFLEPHPSPACRRQGGRFGGGLI